MPPARLMPILSENVYQRKALSKRFVLQKDCQIMVLFRYRFFGNIHTSNRLALPFFECLNRFRLKRLVKQSNDTLLYVMYLKLICSKYVMTSGAGGWGGGEER
jgi:hypothetical protein